MQKLNIIPKEIQLRIVDFLEGTINDQELSLLNQWICENDQNLNQFNAFKSVWLLSEKSIPVNTVNSEAALIKIKENLNQEKVRHLRQFWHFLRIAASWLLFFIIGVTVSLIFVKPYQVKKAQQKYINVTAPLGAKSLVDLPDGTTVWLNAGSKITYNNTYGILNREVRLSGEAYFSVSANKKIPFLVRTSDV
ncbi:MAG TPA: FecR family protein, partial [Bacteroidales bacterium]|nr:FecR family protein [Bacteroidales bacterium]